DATTVCSIVGGSDDLLHNAGSSLDIIIEEKEGSGVSGPSNSLPEDTNYTEPEVEHDYNEPEVDHNSRLLSENNSKSIFICAENLEELLGLQFDGVGVEASNFNEEKAVLNNSAEFKNQKSQDKSGKTSKSPSFDTAEENNDLGMQNKGNNDVTRAAKIIVCKLREVAQISSATPNAGKSLEQAVTDICTNTMLIVSFARIVARLCLDQRKLGPNLIRTIEPVESICTQMKVLASVTAKSLMRQEELDESETSLGVMSGKLTQTIVSILKDSEACCLKVVFFNFGSLVTKLSSLARTTGRCDRIAS
ncbi:uncharacterized protein LOC142358036, partial [Convolutriloba macropyga]|uniref:uncharacterized protein LOC142358036 n=1 Tax=Convolutriloba macropyga TaxID=536237 RepID=UPI003F52469E